MTDNLLSYQVELDIPAGYSGDVLDFINAKYLQPQRNEVADVSRITEASDPVLSFTILNPEQKPTMKVEIRSAKPITVKMSIIDETAPTEMLENIKQDLNFLFRSFEEHVREDTLFFAWREGEAVKPERVSEKGKRSINRLFLETQILLFILFIVIGAFLWFFIGWLVPIVILALQFVFVFFSSKIIARMADWRITENNPSIHLLEYRLPLEEHEKLNQKLSKTEQANIKNEMYERTIAKNGEIDCDTMHEIFTKHGIPCNPENLIGKKVDVYHLVKKVADKFGFPMPDIVVSNTIIPNAAASGPSPRRGVVLITTGLLAHLNEDEIISVLGHEFGHLKGRDPLSLYALTSAQYLFTFYFAFSLFPWIFDSILFIAYFWAIMTALYFVAKFFEARADLTSAMIIGEPKTLARSLEHIGFKRLMYERAPAYRFQQWIGFDPHPPIYFRINRLEKLQVPVNIKHPFARSAKDVTRAFLANLGF
jgi:heat shock protein HtpX